MRARNLFYTHIKGKPVKRIVQGILVRSSHGFSLHATLECGHQLKLAGNKYAVGGRVCCEECKP